MSDDLSALSTFGGTARLFPLPNVVLYPHVIQPLHVFEPRYRQMAADALAGDRLIAMVLLREEWESDYEGRPALHPVACIGKIITDQRLADGRYNLLLRGLSRVRLVEELSLGKLYRTARVELLQDRSAPAGETAQRLRRQLSRLVMKWFKALAWDPEQLRKLVKSDLPLGTLCDLLSFVLPLDVSVKQRALEELHVEQRVLELIPHLRAETPAPQTAAARPFPPEFSQN
jgi:uncharacterized protein